MRVLKIFALTLLVLICAQGTTFAEMPEISAGEKYYDVFKDLYVLRKNVRVSLNNRKFTGKISADEAHVSLSKQCCWANGKVKVEQDNITFGCERAYIDLPTKTASVTGKVKFESKSAVTINADSAVFNWDTKIVDFYGKIKLKADKNVKLADGVKIDGKNYQHVQYNVVEKKILALDKKFDAPEIVIPSETT